MNNQKPTLRQFGLTEKQVQDNEYAKNNRRKIIAENDKIDRNATKYGWIGFFISLTLLIIIGFGVGVGDFSIIFIGISVVVGVLTNAITKKSKKEVPTFSSSIDERYKNYLKAVNEYEKLEKIKAQRLATTLTKTTPSVQTKLSTTSYKINTVLETTSPKPHSKHSKYQVGMIVKHAMFGTGRIVNISTDNKTLDIKFEDTLEYKKFVSNLVKLEILENPTKSTTKEKPITKAVITEPVKNHKMNLMNRE